MSATKRGATFLAALALGAAPAFASDPVDVDTGAKNLEGTHPSIASDDKGGLHVAYLSYEKGAKLADVHYTASTDGGKTWRASQNVSSSPGIVSHPVITSGKGETAIFWLDSRSGLERPDIFGAVSTDEGKTWSKPANVSNSPGKSSDPACVIAPDGTIHVVWSDNSSSMEGPDIWHAMSTDKGKTWEKAKDISHTPGVSSHPAVTCGPKGEVYVCWRDTTSGESNPDIFFCASTDGGKTFSKSLDMSNTPKTSAPPDIAADEQGVYIVWADSSSESGQWDIFFSASRDGGKTWEKYRDAAPTPGISTTPAICAAEGHLVVVWKDTTDHEATPNIWSSVSADHGKTWSKPTDVSNNQGGVADSPDVTIAHGTVYTIWEQDWNCMTHVKLASAPLK
jgi:Neuraminidase (sialidase)